MKARWLTVVIFFTTLSLLLTASAAASTASPQVHPAPIDALSSESLNLNLGADPTTIDPALALDDTSWAVAEQLFIGLVDLDDDTSTIKPALASSWTLSPDTTVYTFTLRSDVFWTDGNPVTAGDVRYGILRSLNPATASGYAYILYPIKNAEAYNTGAITDASQVGVTTLDATHLQIMLARPASSILSILALWPARPVPQTVVETYGSAWTDPAYIVTNGAYRLTEWIHGNHILLDKNPTYYDAANVQINQVKMWLVDNITAWTMYQNGQLDTAVVPDGTGINAALRPEVHIQPNGDTNSYLFNVAKAPFNNLLVRKAFMAAVEHQGLVKNALGGVALPALTYTPPGLFGYVDGFTAGVGIPYNPAQARAWLAQAGYPDGKGLPPITLWFNTSPVHQAVAVYVKKQWQTNLGVRVTLKDEEWQKFLGDAAQGKFQIWRMGWRMDYPDAYNFLKDGQDNGSWSNATYNSILNQAARETRPNARKLLYKQAEQILVQDNPAMLPLYFGDSLVATRSYLTRTYPARAWFDIAAWRIAPITVENEARNVQYNSWRGKTGAGASGGSYRVSSSQNDMITYTFTGTYVDWRTRKGPDQGKALVMIDNGRQVKKTVDLYDPLDKPNFSETFAGLPNTTHTITIKVLRTKNPFSTDFNVVMDAFLTGSGTMQENDPAIQYNTWRGAKSANASGGTYCVSGTSGAVVSFSFIGSAIDWITTKGPSYGLADVSIDGANQGTVDLYQPTVQWNAPVSFTGLSNGTHTIQVKVSGDKNPASTGTKVVVDAFRGIIIPQ